MSTRHAITPRPGFARAIRKLSPLVILAWVAIAVLVSVGIPPLEQVAKERPVSLSVKDAESVKAMTRIGTLFKESDTDSVAVVVLESSQPLGQSAHQYYDDLVRRLSADTKHVQHIQDFWGDPVTAQGVQSSDGKAAYVQLNLSGNQGEALAIESVHSVRHIIDSTPAPDGVKAYLTGPTPLSADMAEAGDKTAIKITIVTTVVISLMLLLVYRSISTVVIVMAIVGIELTAVRGIVAALCHYGIISVSAFGISILVALAIAAGTDYGIFFIGRYHEARRAGEDRERAYFTAYRGVAHVILASGLTIAGATYCLSFTRLPIFQTMGASIAVGMLAAVAVALTLIPAVLALASRFGLLEPKRTASARGWRRIGTAIVRWPGPIFVASCALALIGLLALPAYQVSYEDRPYMPQNTPAQIGWAVADRHFPEARMRPEVLMVESDRDMRNPADFLVLNKVAKRVFGVEGIALVQGATRPEGTPLEHTSIPFLMSMQSAGQLQNMPFLKDQLEEMRKQTDSLDGTIASMEQAYALMQQLAEKTHHMVAVTHDMMDITKEVRDNVANVDDFYRPIRNGVYWEQHCDNIPTCVAERSAFEASDGIDKISEKLDDLAPDLDNVNTIIPELIKLMPPQIQALKSARTMLQGTYSTTSGMIEQMEQLGSQTADMGHDFDAAQNDDSFYLPKTAFDNPEFQKVISLFLSPDGKAARFIITHRDNPASEAGIARINPIKVAAEEALKGTPLANSKIYVAGTGAVLKDLKEGSSYDLLIAGVASLGIIFAIMLLITRSIVASLVIVGTVVASLGASFGISVLIWQEIVGINLHWMVLLMSIIILLAVGADYNLLLIARFREELGAGLRTGMIRAMGGTGKIVTTAGVVFAFTMASMLVSDLLVVGQVGTTIGLGLLLDTLVVRSFMTPSVAALLGRWFWWPVRIPARPRGRHDAGSGPRAALVPPLSPSSKVA